jgi:hypothetical protein
MKTSEIFNHESGQSEIRQQILSASEENRMDYVSFAKEMFKAEPTIRYVAVVDLEYNVLVSKQREGVPSLTSDEVTQRFVSIVPQIIVDSVDKLSPYLGKVGGITAHYDKVLVIFYRVGDLIVVISFEKDEPTPFYDRVTGSFQKVSSRFLT